MTKMVNFLVVSWLWVTESIMNKCMWYFGVCKSVD